MGKRIITRRRGAGTPPYTSPSHRYRGEIGYPQIRGASGIVEHLMHDPGHSTPVAEVRWTLPTGETRSVLHLAHQGMAQGSTVHIGETAEPKPGNILPLGNIPEGTLVFNIENNPGDGGRYVRSGGTAATVVAHGDTTTIQLPSGAFKRLPPTCRATVGMVAGGGRGEKWILKAGKNYHRYRSKAKVWPTVKGVSMNPVDHPHGGGNHPHVGRPSTVSVHAWPGRKVGRISSTRRMRLRKRGGRKARARLNALEAASKSGGQ